MGFSNSYITFENALPVSIYPATKAVKTVPARSGYQSLKKVVEHPPTCLLARLALNPCDGLNFPLFGMQCVALEPAQAQSPKLISHVSGSLTLYSNKLSSFELHLLIYFARELLTLYVCVCGYALVACERLFFII